MRLASETRQRRSARGGGPARIAPWMALGLALLSGLSMWLSQGRVTQQRDRARAALTRCGGCCEGWAREALPEWVHAVLRESPGGGAPPGGTGNALAIPQKTEAGSP